MTSLAVHAQGRDSFCGRGLPPGFEAAAQRARSGRYVNPAYGYSVEIPAGLTAVVSLASPQRGFVVPLSDSPLAYLRVDAAYDAYYDITPAGVHQRDLNTIRLHDAVLGDEAAAESLSRERGGRFSVRLQCRGDVDIVVHEAVIVVRRREIYRLDLQSTPERLAKDRRQLDAMVRSWRWEPIR